MNHRSRRLSTTDNVTQVAGGCSSARSGTAKKRAYATAPHELLPDVMLDDNSTNRNAARGIEGLDRTRHSSQDGRSKNLRHQRTGDGPRSTLSAPSREQNRFRQPAARFLVAASGVRAGVSTGRRASPYRRRFGGTPTQPCDGATQRPPGCSCPSNISAPSNAARTSVRNLSAGRLGGAPCGQNFGALLLDDASVFRKLVLGPWGACTPCRVKPWRGGGTPFQGAFHQRLYREG